MIREKWKFENSKLKFFNLSCFFPGFHFSLATMLAIVETIFDVWKIYHKKHRISRKKCKHQELS